jgi:glutamate racemase
MATSRGVSRERGVLIAEALARQGAKAMVIACNTATAAAAEAIRAATQLPVVALEPGVKPAAQLTKSGVVGVLATTRTLHSDRFPAPGRQSCQPRPRPRPGLPRAGRGDRA